VSQSCNLRTFGDAENLAGTDGGFTIVEDYKQPHEEDDESVLKIRMMDLHSIRNLVSRINHAQASQHNTSLSSALPLHAPPMLRTCIGIILAPHSRFWV
jgi:hypothetical protein